MAHEDDKDGFISLLLEETYNSLPGSPDSIKNNKELEDYFNGQTTATKNSEYFNKLENIVKKNKDNIFKLSYNESTKMFRTFLHDSVIDFPSNFSVFSTLHHCGLGRLHGDKDSDFLVRVLLPFDYERGGILTFTVENNSFLVLAKDSKRIEEYIKFLSEAFEKAA